jgi:hypothetical protein
MAKEKQAPLGKSVKISIPSQNLEIDPRGKSSFRGKGVYIATGDKVTVKGTGKARKQTAKWY